MHCGTCRSPCRRLQMNIEVYYAFRNDESSTACNFLDENQAAGIIAAKIINLHGCLCHSHWHAYSYRGTCSHSPQKSLLLLILTHIFPNSCIIDSSNTKIATAKHISCTLKWIYGYPVNPEILCRSLLHHVCCMLLYVSHQPMMETSLRRPCTQSSSRSFLFVP